MTTNFCIDLVFPIYTHKNFPIEMGIPLPSKQEFPFDTINS